MQVYLYTSSDALVIAEVDLKVLPPIGSRIRLKTPCGSKANDSEIEASLATFKIQSYTAEVGNKKYSFGDEYYDEEENVILCQVVPQDGAAEEYVKLAETVL